MPLRPAWKHDDSVVDDERGSGHAPGQIRGAVLVEDVGPPEGFPGGLVETPELTLAAERVHAAGAPRRRRTRSVAAHAFVEERGPCARP